MAKSRENTKELTPDEATQQQNELLERIEKMNKINAERRRELDEVQVVLQVKDLAHARTEEVLSFCLRELNSGTTYNELRRKLGLGPAAHDHRWRTIRNVLGEMILPASEEEQLKAAHAQSAFMIERLEKFLERVNRRAEALKNADNEAQMMKLEVETIKLIMDKYDKQTEHYLKMKDLQKREKGATGQTIVFNNKFYIPRPGETRDVKPLEEVAVLSAKLDEIQDE